MYISKNHQKLWHLLQIQSKPGTLWIYNSELDQNNTISENLLPISSHAKFKVNWVFVLSDNGKKT